MLPRTAGTSWLWLRVPMSARGLYEHANFAQSLAARPRHVRQTWNARTQIHGLLG